MAPRVGSNVTWTVNYVPDILFADAAKHAVITGPGGTYLAATDVNGWPEGPSVVAFLNDEGNNIGATGGNYLCRFVGNAAVTVPNGGGTISNLSYNAGTNTTTFTLTVLDGNNNTLGFGAGFTDLRIMRPGYALDDARVFYEPWLNSTLSWATVSRHINSTGPSYTNDQNSGTNGNYERFWDYAEAVAAGIPAWQPNTPYVPGGGTPTYVLNAGRVWRCRVGGTSASSGGPRGGGLWGGEAGSSIFALDGSCQWARADRQARPATSFCANNGIAWEDLIRLANRYGAGKGVWFNVPMFASNNYVRQLARLMRYGSDANGTPYTSTQAGPVNPPLAPGVIAYLEICNEVWNFGYGTSGDWQDKINGDVGARGDPTHLATYTRTAANGGETIYSWAQRSNGQMFDIVRWSLIFREVFTGTTAMMNTIRPVWPGQIGWGIDDAVNWQSQQVPSNTGTPVWDALDYLNNVWGPGSVYNTVSDPYNGTTITNPKQPASYYIYAVSGAPYVNLGASINPNDTSAANMDAYFADLQAAIPMQVGSATYYKHWAYANGIKFCAYEWGTQFLQGWQPVHVTGFADPRMRTLISTLGNGILATTPPAGGWMWTSDTVDVAIYCNGIGNGPMGLIPNYDTPTSGPGTPQRQLGINDVVASLGSAWTPVLGQPSRAGHGIPRFSLVGETVVVDSPITGDAVYWSTSGPPRRSAANRYTGPITVTAGTTVYARAWQNGKRLPLVSVTVT